MLIRKAFPGEWLKQTIWKGLALSLLPDLLGWLLIEGAFGSVNEGVQVFPIKQRTFADLDRHQLAPFYHPVQGRRRNPQILAGFRDR